MSDSVFKRVQVNDMNDIVTGGPSGTDGAVSGTPSPTTIYGPVNTPKRVMLRNTSTTVTIFVALDANVLQTQPPGSDCYELPPGISDVFAIDAKQKLFGIADGSDGKLSVAVSDAFPIDADLNLGKK